MKRSLIITIGVVVALIVIGIWVYLLFFGTPDNSDDIFSDLGLGEPSVSTPTPTPEPQPETPQTQVDTRSGGLQQLTTRPVAGFGFMGTSSSLLRYVERGTGHIYELDIDSGSETRVSGTTIPRVVESEFSGSGSHVIQVSEDGTERTILIGTIDHENTSTEYVTLSAAVSEATFINEKKVGYIAYEDRGIGGYEYDLSLRDPVRLFLISLQDVRMIWHDGEPYVYNSPTRHYTGSLYEIQDSDLVPRTAGEHGFVTGMNDSYIFGSYVRDRGYTSYALDRETSERIPLATTYIPEKCDTVANSPDALWCASSFQEYGRSFIENWYKGIITSRDVLWRINVPFGEAQLVSDFFDESGRRIDVDMLMSSADGPVVLFRNRLDNTLWMYDTRSQ